MTTPSVKLPRNADELLRDLPLPEPDFEAQARAIEERLLQGVPSVAALSPELLLEVPSLDAEPGEPALASQVRAAPKSHFAEMARRSVGKPNDDAAQLAKELLAATAHRRRPDAQMVARVRAAGKGATATPLPLSEPRRDRHSGVVPRADASSPTATAGVARAEGDKRGLFIALAGVALAAAAAVALFAKSPPEAVEGSTSRPAVAATAEVVPAARPAPAPRGEEPLTLNALPTAVAAAKEAPPPEAARTPKPGPAPARARSALTPSSALASAAPVRSAEGVPATAAREPVKGAESAPEPALRPAQGHSDNVPLNPSSGAVSTALASVRSGVQACLAGQTDPVRVSVTFASDGHVSSVAAGGPSGACLQAAFSQARISPFARDSFTATTTVRPP